MSPPSDNPQPRPCDRCRKFNLACIFNPLSRSYCNSCKEKKVRCSNAFKIVTDHCMATYLGYASFRMASDPSTYVEPTFTPTNLPNPLPTNIEWYRALYEQAKKVGKTRAKKAVPSSVVVAPSTDEDVPLDFPAPPATVELPRESSHRSRQSTPLTTRSQSVSQAPSRASSTMPGSSAVSVELPPPSPSAVSEMSHAPPLETAAATPPGDASHSEAFNLPDGMSIDDEAGADAITGADDRRSSDGGEEETAPHPHAGTSQTSGKMVRLMARGSEFDIPSTSRRELGVFPPPPRGAARRMTSIHLVPRLQGESAINIVPFLFEAYSSIAESWNKLPSIGPRMGDGHYSVVPPPHNEDWIARWEALTNTGGSTASEPWNADRHLHSHVEPAAEPQRPPSRTFTVSDEVQRIVGATRELFDEIALIKERMQMGARLHRRQGREVLLRRPSNPQQPHSGDDESSLIRLDDLSSIFTALGEVYSVLTKFSTAFNCIPAVPINWDALSDLLTQIGQLRDLYKTSWEHFASLEEDVRPLRAEMQRIRYGVAHVQERLDGISNDAVTACEPLIHNLYQQIDARLSHLENVGAPSPAPLPAQLGDVLKILTRLSERVEQLERAAEAEDFRTRIDGYIARYLSDRGLHDDILRQLGVGETPAPASTSAGSSISHLFQAGHRAAPRSGMSFGTSLPGSTLSSISPSPAVDYPHGAASVPAGIRQLEPPLNVTAMAANAPAPSAAPPSGAGSFAVPQVASPLDRPAHGHTEGGGTGGEVGIPQRGTRSVVSKMHSKIYGGTSSTRRRGT